VVPPFDDLAVADPHDDSAAEVDPTSRFSVSAGDPTARRPEVTVAQHLLDLYSNWRELWPQSAIELPEAGAALQRDVVLRGESVQQTVGRHYFVNRLLAAFVPDLGEPALQDVAIARHDRSPFTSLVEDLT
jgi:hypothetical protein